MDTIIDLFFKLGEKSPIFAFLNVKTSRKKEEEGLRLK